MNIPKKTFTKEWMEIPMRQKIATSFFIIWPLLYLGVNWLVGCGGVNEAYVKSVVKYSTPLIKDHKKMLDDDWNPIWFQREPILDKDGKPIKDSKGNQVWGKPLYNKPVSQTAKDMTKETRGRAGKNLKRINDKALETLNKDNAK